MLSPATKWELASAGTRFCQKLAKLPPQARVLGIVQLARAAKGPVYAQNVLSRLAAGSPANKVVAEILKAGYRSPSLGTTEEEMLTELEELGRQQQQSGNANVGSTTSTGSRTNTGTSRTSTSSWSSRWDTLEEVSANLDTITSGLERLVTAGIGIGTSIDDAIHGRSPADEENVNQNQNVQRLQTVPGASFMLDLARAFQRQPQPQTGGGLLGGMNPLLVLGALGLLGVGVYMVVRKPKRSK